MPFQLATIRVAGCLQWDNLLLCYTVRGDKNHFCFGVGIWDLYMPSEAGFLPGVAVNKGPDSVLR